ncbi:aldehyde dehydrogenase family protein [Olivibacter sp. SDN3]|uniref:aldehyde dehydrogenase family protein n=1 Tax=Olivibacter sp. SDN3 TaxID=2764720 RepID=UPI0016515EB9|nr:aldehyde dehydrogenase family protein [Olivibacter sp. SDN3]QNL50635.1 aldehyde dehydrogenase family protein [Olivibacter sp. SDN3]
MKIINPTSTETIIELVDDHPERLLEKYNTLQAARADWSQKLLAERMIVIAKFVEGLKEEIESLAGILTAETGKPIQQARNEINGAISRISWMMENVQKYLSPEQMRSRPHLEETITYEPLGTICNISAWNYPYLVGVNVFIPALLAGNTVLYKPSEFATNTGLQIDRLLKRAGLPDNVLQVAIGGADVGKALLDLDFDGYYFTGSYKTGKAIYKQVASKMVPCQLEMGGKDPLYITDDLADVKAVAEATADGAFYNNGQSCCAVERIYVHEAVYDAYVEAFVAQVKRWKLGDPIMEDVYFGPLTRSAQLLLLEDQVADALAKGATLLLGGRRADRRGYYFEPTVLVNVNHDMALMREESFGPIIGIMKVRNDEEAVALMQDTDYGLTASVYADQQMRAVSILTKINIGTAYWNCCDRVSAALPWSGRQHSGLGVTLSHQGIRAFTKPKAWHLIGQ